MVVTYKMAPCQLAFAPSGQIQVHFAAQFAADSELVRRFCRKTPVQSVGPLVLDAIQNMRAVNSCWRSLMHHRELQRNASERAAEALLKDESGKRNPNGAFHCVPG